MSERRKRRKWNYDIFMAELDIIHEGKYDYSNNSSATITSTNSYLKIICRICGRNWEAKFCSHYYNKRGCADCSERSPYTLERFVSKAKAIHGNRFDYSKLKPKDVINSSSRVLIICTICGYEWDPRICEHINSRNGCPDCAGLLPYNVERFVKKARKFHGDLYDYSHIKEEHIKNCESKVPILCLKCNEISWIGIRNHINARTGCRTCHQSKGEIACKNALRSLELSYETQFQIQISSLMNKKYDFAFIFQNRYYLLEFDGQQHFEYNEFFHNHNEEDFEHRQQTDILKTNAALRLKYCVIRIDYTQIDNIEQHIRNALNENYWLYVTNTFLYKYILDNIRV